MEAFLAKLIVLGFHKEDNYYCNKDVTLRLFKRTGTVYINCYRSELKALDKFIHYEEALPIILELL